MKARVFVYLPIVARTHLGPLARVDDIHRRFSSSRDVTAHRAADDAARSISRADAEMALRAEILRRIAVLQKYLEPLILITSVLSC